MHSFGKSLKKFSMLFVSPMFYCKVGLNSALKASYYWCASSLGSVSMLCQFFVPPALFLKFRFKDMRVRVANTVLHVLAPLQQMHGGLHVGKRQLLPEQTAFMCLLCLCHVKVWPIPHRSSSRTKTHSARLNTELTWASPRGSLRRMPGHGVCRGALGWQWSLGPRADGLQETYW